LHGFNSDEIIGFPIALRLTIALGMTQPLAEKKNTRKLPRGKGCPELKADNLTAVCEPTV
jgi:hypothetical protein